MKVLLALAGAGVLLAVVVNLATSDPKAEFQRSAPAYASAMTDSYGHNKCIVETANQLRAIRDDFLARAVAVCDGAEIVARG